MYINADSAKITICQIKQNLDNLFLACNLIFSAAYILEM